MYFYAVDWLLSLEDTITVFSNTYNQFFGARLSDDYLVFTVKLTKILYKIQLLEIKSLHLLMFMQMYLAADHLFLAMVLYHL